MKWATRTRPHVDRTACAWVITRFVDPDAEFVFVTEHDELPADATPLDMRGVELSHRDGGCTMETLLREHGLEDEALWRIARIIHEADLEDDRYDAPEAAGLDAVMRGLTCVRDDHAALEVSAVIYDGLYAYFGGVRR